MATLVLQAAGAAIGGMLGGPMGAMAGRTLGAIAGGVIDNRLMGFLTHAQMPQLHTLNGLGSVEGTPVPRVYGRARVGGQVIWATRFLEVNGHQSAGGKGTGPRVTTYNYYANFAVGLCEGPIAYVRRVWADGKEIDLTLLNVRIYPGDETQTADPLIIAKEGLAPAYRGMAYAVFELMPLANYGNRIPQLNFEVVRPVSGLASMIRAVDLIPGSSEYAYSPLAFTSSLGAGSSVSENRHQLQRVSDWTASIDALQALCPNLKNVALVVSWFGNDLRCGSCTITPRVEDTSKLVLGGDWQVAGLARGDATPVSLYMGQPAFGGTPTDASVSAAIQDLKTRGLGVTFYPFVMMDIADGNALPDPWSSAASQAPYPWRGRMTCTPAAGLPGTVDGTPAAGAQVAAFFGSSSPPAGEWSFRQFILHYAGLCQNAGGVDTFLVGSELASLTRVRSASGIYPAALALAQLCADVKGLLGAATKVSYAADWSEYGTHVLNGGAEVRFPLDAVWASPHCDFIGLDAYWPLSDWRDGTAHLDAQIATSVHQRSYLAANMAAGEAYDFYYATAADRFAQQRTPITDGAYNKPWMFRAKDLIGFWSNTHIERVNGVELATPTAFVPMSKPIWLIETGCPAVDRGTNAPNVFPDPKSSENGLPPFSRGGRDDLIQLRALEAVISHFDASQTGFVAGSNPVSPLYNGPMVDPQRIYLWAWDARPFPAFPEQSGVWADAVNWATGHWLNGRLESVALEDLLPALLNETPALQSTIDVPQVDGLLDGYVLDRTLTARGAIEPLAAMYGFNVLASAGHLRCVPRSQNSVATLVPGDLVPDKQGRLVTLTRGEDSSLPRELALSFSDSERFYRSATALSRRLKGYAERDLEANTAAILRMGEAQRLADMWLEDLWVQRETATFTLRPGLIALEPGDTVELPVAGAARLMRITKITDSADRKIEARLVEPDVYDKQARDSLAAPVASPAIPGPPRVVILDLAIATADPAVLQYMAVASSPWPGPMAVYQAADAQSFNLFASLTQCAIIGDTLSALGPGPAGRIDPGNSVTVKIGFGTLSSVGDTQMLAGAANMAIAGPDGTWEIFAFASATLIAPQTYQLSRLIRGLGGAEALCQRNVPAGATVVLLNSALLALGTGASALGVAETYKVGPASRDYTDATYVTVAATPGALALMPYAPVQVRAQRSAAGVSLQFIRRGRLGSDAWDQIDIPLGEASEAYQIDILAGGVVKSTLNLTSPAALYPAANELADFGAPQTALSLAIYQMSAAVGRGFPLKVTIGVS